jgi:hypothetical protein
MNLLSSENEDNLLKIMESSYNDLMESLYSLRGINDQAFQLLCDVLEECESRWKEVNFIPKRAANIFMDAYSAILSTSDLYESIEGKETIVSHAERLQDFIRKCCVV